MGGSSTGGGSGVAESTLAVTAAIGARTRRAESAEIDRVGHHGAHGAGVGKTSRGHSNIREIAGGSKERAGKTNARTLMPSTLRVPDTHVAQSVQAAVAGRDRIGIECVHDCARVATCHHKR